MIATFKALIVLVLMPLFCVAFIVGMIWNALESGFTCGSNKLTDWFGELVVMLNKENIK